MKHLIVLFALLFVYSCRFSEHKTAKEIYESGEIGDTTNWYMPRINMEADRDTLRYKYDTALLAQRAYFWKNDKRKLHGIMFYYKNVAQGKSYLLIEDSTIGGEVHYKDGKYDGDFIVYYENHVKKVDIHYKNGSPVYLVNYAEDGRVLDSVLAK